MKLPFFHVVFMNFFFTDELIHSLSAANSLCALIFSLKIGRICKKIKNKTDLVHLYARLF